LTVRINGKSDDNIELQLGGPGSISSVKELVKLCCKKLGRKYSSSTKVYTKEGVHIMEEDDMVLLKEGDTIYLASGGKQAS
jgi:hypothetical protein